MASVVVFMEIRLGTLIVNIEKLYGDVIINMIIMKRVKHHIYMKTSLKNYLLKLLMR